MGLQFSFFYDIAVILIAIVCVCTGYRKGFLKTAVSTGIYLAAFAVSWVASIYISDVLYENYFKEKNYEIVSEYIQSNNLSERLSDELSSDGVEVSSDEIESIASEGSTDKLYSLMQQNGYAGTQEEFNSILTSGVSSAMDSMLSGSSLPYSDAISNSVISSDPEKISSFIKNITNGTYEETVNDICDTYVKELEISVMRILITGLLTTVVMIIANIAISRRKESISGTSRESADSFFGGVWGIVSSLFYIYIFVSVVHIFVATGKEQMVFFNDTVINKTYIFQYFYRVLLNIQIL